MLPSQDTYLERVRNCVCDLRENGIDLIGADESQLRKVVAENLDYFQLMLGSDSRARQVIALIKRERRSALLH